MFIYVAIYWQSGWWNCISLRLSCAQFREENYTCILWLLNFNLLASGIFSNFQGMISTHMLLNKFIRIFVKLLLGDCYRTCDDRSTLVQVMAWCHLAPSHNLSHCWPKFITRNGITMSYMNMVVEIHSHWRWSCLTHTGKICACWWPGTIQIQGIFVHDFDPMSIFSGLAFNQ